MSAPQGVWVQPSALVILPRKPKPAPASIWQRLRFAAALPILLLAAAAGVSAGLLLAIGRRTMGAKWSRVD